MSCRTGERAAPCSGASTGPPRRWATRTAGRRRCAPQSGCRRARARGSACSGAMRWWRSTTTPTARRSARTIRPRSAGRPARAGRRSGRPRSRCRATCSAPGCRSTAATTCSGRPATASRRTPISTCPTTRSGTSGTAASGVFRIVADQTARVTNERRLNTLRALSLLPRTDHDGRRRRLHAGAGGGGSGRCALCAGLPAPARSQPCGCVAGGVVGPGRGAGRLQVHDHAAGLGVRAGRDPAAAGRPRHRRRAGDRQEPPAAAEHRLSPLLGAAGGADLGLAVGGAGAGGRTASRPRAGAAGGGGPGRTRGDGGVAPAVAEDGGDRQADRRRRPRFQQPAAGGGRQPASARPRRGRQRARRAARGQRAGRGRSRRQAVGAAAGVQPPAAAGAAGGADRPSDRRPRRHAAALARRGHRDRELGRGRGVEHPDRPGADGERAAQPGDQCPRCDAGAWAADRGGRRCDAGRGVCTPERRHDAGPVRDGGGTCRSASGSTSWSPISGCPASAACRSRAWRWSVSHRSGWCWRPGRTPSAERCPTGSRGRCGCASRATRPACWRRCARRRGMQPADRTTGSRSYRAASALRSCKTRIRR